MAQSLSHLQSAEDFLQRGEPAKALPFLDKALRGSPDRFLSAEILWKRGEALRAVGDFKAALSDYWASHKLYRQLNVKSERLRALLGASSCLRILGRYRQAAAMWKTVERQRYLYGKFLNADDFTMEQALVLRGAGRLKQARTLLLKCVRGPNHEPEALQHAWWSLGGTERFLGNYRAALAAYRKAGILARRIGDRSSEAYALCGQAGCLRILGDGKQSFQKYQQASRIFQQERDPFGQAYGLCGMGNSLRAYGDAARALPLYKKSHDLYRKVGDEGSLAFALWGMGGSLRRGKRFSDAADRYRRALKIFRQVKDARGEVMALLGLAFVHKEWKGASSAETFLKQAVRVATTEKLPYEKTLADWVRRPENFSGRFKSFGVTDAAVKSWQDLP